MRGVIGTGGVTSDLAQSVWTGGIATQLGDGPLFHGVSVVSSRDEPRLTQQHETDGKLLQMQSNRKRKQRHVRLNNDDNNNIKD